MVNTDCAGGSRGAGIPTTERHAEGRIRRRIQLHKGEVGSGGSRSVDRASAELVEDTVTRAAGSSASGRSAEGVLVVPVHHQGGRVSGDDPAMIRSHEVGGAVLGSIVDHETGTEGRSTGGDHSDTVDFIFPTHGLGAGHVDVAGSGEARSVVWQRLLTKGLMETAVTGVDAGEFDLFLDQGHRILRAANLDDDIAAGDCRSPQFTTVVVVVDGEGTNTMGSLDVVDHHLTVDGK